MKAIARSVNITPERPVGNGRTGKHEPTIGTLDALEASVVLIADERLTNMSNRYYALIGMDAFIASSELESSIAKQLAPCIAGFSIVASHTHNAPVLTPRMQEHYDYRADSVIAAARKISDALNKMMKCETETLKLHHFNGVGSGSVYRRKRTLTINRSPRKPMSLTYAMAADRRRDIPKDIDVILALSDDGGVKLVIWSWACHATAHYSANTFSADFPGHVRKSLRRYYKRDDLTVVFLPGFSGDIRPDHSSHLTMSKARLIYPFARLFGKQTPADYRQFCSKIASNVLATLRYGKLIRSDGSIYLKKLSVPVADFFQGESPIYLEFAHWCIGDFQMLLVSAEVSCDYKDIVKDVFDQPILVSGLAGDCFGYLPTDTQVHEGGYEPDRSQAYYGLSGRFCAALEPWFLKRCKQLVALRLADLQNSGL